MFQLLGVEATKAQLSFDTTVISRVQKVGSIVPLETRIYAVWSLNIEGGNILYNSVCFYHLGSPRYLIAVSGVFFLVNNNTRRCFLWCLNRFFFFKSTSVLQLLLRWQYRLEKAAPSYFWGTNARRPAHSEDWDVCMIVVVATLALWSEFSNFVRLFLDLFSS